MGKPIQKKWFGLATLPGAQIVVNGVKFADGTTATSAYIVKQTGSSAYVVQDTAQTHAPEIVFMVNANATSALMPGQCFITATPYGGSPLPCAKIAQYRLSVYDVPNTVPRETGAPAVSSETAYRWSASAASGPGQASLISGGGIVGTILTLVRDLAGAGYFSAPTITFTGGGTGATAHATLSGGTVATLVLDTPGSGYATGGVTISAPPASVTATATGTQTGGVVDSAVTVVLGGGYYVSAPAVTISGGGTGATAHAVVTNGAVTSIVVDSGGTGYTTPVTFSIAAPPAAVTATGHATVSA